MSFAYLCLGISFIRSTASKVRKSKSKVEGAVSHEGNRKTEKMGSRKHNSIFVSRSDTDASLISGTIASVRNAHARVMTACAMEQGLYSLFAGYDRTLLGQYELFFYNGGDKSGVWKPETMSRKVAETAGEVLSPTASGMGILSGSLSGGQVTEVYLGGYRLATDEEGSAFSRQICEAMKASLGTYGIQQLSQKLRGEQETVKRQEDGQSGYEEEEVLKQYEESKQPEEGTEKNRR